MSLNSVSTVHQGGPRGAPKGFLKGLLGLCRGPSGDLFLALHWKEFLKYLKDIKIRGSYHCMRPISASRQPKIAFLYEFRFCLLPKIAFLYELRFCLLFAISCWTSGFISQITNKKKHYFVTNKRAKIEGDKDVSFDATFTHELLSMPLRLSVLLTICLRKKTYINESTSWSRQYLWQWFDGSIVHCTMV